MRKQKGLVQQRAHIIQRDRGKEGGIPENILSVYALQQSAICVALLCSALPCSAGHIFSAREGEPVCCTGEEGGSALLLSLMYL